MRTDPPEGVVVQHGSYGGHKYVHVGGGRFEFPSLTERDVTHITDIHEGNCTCWPFKRKQHPDGLCVHLRLISGLLKKLKG